MVLCIGVTEPNAHFISFQNILFNFVAFLFYCLSIYMAIILMNTHFYCIQKYPRKWFLIEKPTMCLRSCIKRQFSKRLTKTICSCLFHLTGQKSIGCWIRWLLLSTCACPLSIIQRNQSNAQFLFKSIAMNRNETDSMVNQN